MSTLTIRLEGELATQDWNETLWILETHLSPRRELQMEAISLADGVALWVERESGLKCSLQ
jgi:hypothetical protein